MSLHQPIRRLHDLDIPTSQALTDPISQVDTLAEASNHEHGFDLCLSCINLVTDQLDNLLDDRLKNDADICASQTETATPDVVLDVILQARDYDVY